MERFLAFSDEMGEIVNRINSCIEKYQIADPEKCVGIEFNPLTEDGKFRAAVDYSWF